jgi:NAD(P)-dependent dehydrogenase (short-subunit alcohol dehydrogenase family)
VNRLGLLGVLVAPPRARRRTRRIDAPSGRWLITGTSRGLGCELARLAEDELGAEVVGVDRCEPAETTRRRHVQVDLATRSGLEETLALIRDWKPTVLVNNAAINQSKTVTDSPTTMIDEMIAVGFTTPFMLMREMAMVHRGTDEDTWVINIVSPYRQAGVRTHSLYCATKAAMSRAGEALAVEPETAGSLTVVSVVPGPFNSGFRPVEAHDAWLVRTYRGLRRRGAGPAAVDLIERLRRGTKHRHWTIWLGWDGRIFELLARLGGGDRFVALLDALIGQRAAPIGPAQRAGGEDHQERHRDMAEVGQGQPGDHGSADQQH